MAYGKPLDRTVYGWLNTRHDVGTAVANEVMFYVGREVVYSAKQAPENGRGSEMPAAAQKPVT